MVESDKGKFLDSKAAAEWAKVPLSSGTWGGRVRVCWRGLAVDVTEVCQ